MNSADTMSSPIVQDDSDLVYNALSSELPKFSFPPDLDEAPDGMNIYYKTFPVNFATHSYKPTENVEGWMQVELFEPSVVKYEHPIILLHGDYHTGNVWKRKPDGGRGWASIFNYQGFRVYVVDMPWCGKSNWTVRDREPLVMTDDDVAEQFTAPSRRPLPRGSRFRTHTQWPGSGQPGCPVFERYLASRTRLSGTKVLRQRVGQVALANLLIITGKAYLIGEHSGATLAWLAADAKPDLVAAVLAMHAEGPPFLDAPTDGSEDFTSNRPAPGVRKFGIADVPLIFNPPAAVVDLDSPSQPLNLTLTSFPDAPGGQCILQKNPPRKLTNLQKMPHSIWSGQATNNSNFDWTVQMFLQQAGCSVWTQRLCDYHLSGDGPLAFIERQSSYVAYAMVRWIDCRLSGA